MPIEFYPFSLRCIQVSISLLQLQVVLWFIYNQVIHKRDIEAIANSKRSHPNLFALNILAAADQFQLKGLRRQCESYITYGEVIFVLVLYSPNHSLV